MIRAFHGTCAYCESPDGRTGGAIKSAHYRPPGGVLRADGTFDRRRYWWLAYEWENLLALCETCATLKGNRFAILGAEAPIESTGEALDAEIPLLIDPRRDRSADHFVYQADGSVTSTTNRGQYTIELLALNRDWLVGARRDVIDHTRGAAADPNFLESIDLGLPYVSCILQTAVLVTDDRTGLSAAHAAAVASTVTTEAPAGYENLGAYFAESSMAQEDFRRGEAWQTSPGDDEDYFLIARTVTKVELHNYRVIKDLTLDFGEGPTWRVLLGDNGTGKSSVLEAIAMTLIGPSYRDEMGVTPGACLRDRCREGWIRVTLSGLAEPIELRFTRGESTFVGGVEQEVVPILGFGATRLLPRIGAAHAVAHGEADVANLFNPFVALGDADDWLCNRARDQPEVFAAAVRALAELLDPDADTKFRVRAGDDGGDRVEVRAFGTWQGLEEMSDGYQAVVALAVHIMQIVSLRWPAMEIAEGIVLVDELEAHLHPRWQLMIVRALRTAFPRLQFVVSTHSPLSLRGLVDGEVILLVRGKGSTVEAVTDLPPVEGLRVDQLLVSPHFGLHSTLDPEVDQKIGEYYELLAKDRTPAQQAQMEELRAEVRPYERLSSDPAEETKLRVVEAQLAAEAQKLSTRGIPQLDDAAMTKLKDIFEVEDRKRRSRRRAPR